ncbi:hypothetical protein V7S43_015132 [Phytophthora oleae]|uniref:Uncharacterized protein n=1 Tax=Phytophthora oleae TaxID=2107226 RepID=A0ABD3F355_9STRA
MSREVYFQLVDATTRLPVWSTFVDAVDLPEDASVVRFRRTVWNQVKPILPPHMIAANLRVYTNITVYDDKDGQPMEEDSTIGALGASKKDALIVVVPQRESGVPAVHLFHDGVNPQAPHLARVELLSRVHGSMQHRFILFLSLAASGKTSLLSLFACRYPDLNCIPVSFLRLEVSAVDLLRSCGIDVYGRTTSLSPHQNHVVMIDDAQARYAEKDFWTTLIKVAPSWLPANVRLSSVRRMHSKVEVKVQLSSNRLRSSAEAISC